MVMMMMVIMMMKLEGRMDAVFENTLETKDNPRPTKDLSCLVDH